MPSHGRRACLGSAACIPPQGSMHAAARKNACRFPAQCIENCSRKHVSARHHACRRAEEWHTGNPRLYGQGCIGSTMKKIVECCSARDVLRSCAAKVRIFFHTAGSACTRKHGRPHPKPCASCCRSNFLPRQGARQANDWSKVQPQRHGLHATVLPQAEALHRDLHAAARRNGIRTVRRK